MKEEFLELLCCTYCNSDLKLSIDEINKIKERILTGGHVGSVVSNDFTSSLIKVELTEFNRKTGAKLDYLQLGKDIEKIRDEFEQGIYRVEITGFAKMISDIASEAYNVVRSGCCNIA